MYLKKLELVGFKSFAARIEFEFVPGITVIVGPNGSGKSNVTDAIRWVLGEQSVRTLRGSKMEDVIFAGSDSRKPVGYCEVTITFGNESRRLPVDYSEVTVTRRVYRSGEGEYYLNKQACRLKDIHELFMDTGIGRDTYSMIGQGRIDEILSHKSDERRAIFEDAAGIVKYKTRKKEAEKKLEGTSQNLVRIHDLIYQLEDQIEPLIEKVEIAHEYKALLEELKELEIGLYVHQIEDLHQKWQESCGIVTELEEENTLLASELSGKEASLEEITYILTQHEEKWAQEQELLLSVNSELEKAEGSKRLYLEKVSHIVEKKQQLEKREKQLISEVDRYEGEKKGLEQQLKKKMQEEMSVQKELQVVQESSIHTEYADRFVDVTQKVQEQKEKMIELQTEQTYTIQQLEDIEEKIQQLQRQKKYTEEEIHSLCLEEQEVTKQFDMIEQQRNRNIAQLQTWQTSVYQYEQMEKDLSLEVQQAEQKGTQLRSQIEMLEDIQADHTGFFHGVKEILLARDRGLLKGVHGAVSQLVYVPQEYEIAIETALGSAAQHLVVENEQVGRQGILWLKEKRLGRATFLPLDVLQNRYMPKIELSNVSKIAGFMGVASDLVSTEEQYSIVARNLLGLIVISKNLKDATQIAQILKHRYRVVTLDGDVMNPGGSMSGGSRQKAKTNLLGRPRQLEALKVELKTSQSLYEEKLQELRLVEKKKKQFHEEKENLLSCGEALRVELQELTSKKKELNLQRQSQSVLVDHVCAEYEGLLDRKKRIALRNKEITHERHLLQNSLTQLNQEMEELQAFLKKQ